MYKLPLNAKKSIEFVWNLHQFCKTALPTQCIKCLLGRSIIAELVQIPYTFFDKFLFAFSGLLHIGIRLNRWKAPYIHGINTKKLAIQEETV